MLGMKGAGDEDDLFKIRVQLTKPVTWVPLIWGERACWCLLTIALLGSQPHRLLPRLTTQPILVLPT
jgi:hypothetical protein